MQGNLCTPDSVNALPWKKRNRNDLGEALFLQVGDDALSHEIGRANNVQDLVVILPQERQFEAILSGIDGDSSRLGVAIQTVHHLALDAREVDRLFQRLDDAIVPISGAELEPCLLDKGSLDNAPLRQSIFDVIEGRIDEYATVIPRSRLDANRLVDHGARA